MPIPQTLEKLDDIPETFRDSYKEVDGKYVLATVPGFKAQSDFEKVNEALRKEREDHKGTKTKYSVFGDKTPDDILAQLDRIDELEAAAKGKLNEEQISELVEKRLKPKLAPIERELGTYKTKLAEAESKIGEYTAKERQRAITDAVREAIGKSDGFQSAAVEDALLLAERVLEIDESGAVVTRDGVGVTPGVAPGVWLTEIQTKRPHWWGPTQGGGARGGTGSGVSGGKNPFSAEHWNLTEQGRLIQANRANAEQLAKAAGTKIGGGKPAPKK